MTTLPQTTPMRLPRPNPSQLAIPGANGHATPALSHPGQQQTSLTGADAWRVIRSNLWLIVGLLVVAGIAGYFINWWLAAKYARFTSTGLIRVQVPSELPSIGDHPLLLADPSPQSIEVEQQTQAASITNRYFLSSIIEDPASPIRSTGWFQEWGNRIDRAKEDLVEKLDVSPKQNTRLIGVSFSCAAPKDALVVVREVINRHIAERKQKVQNLWIQKSSDLNTMIEHYRAEQQGHRDHLALLAQELAKHFYNGEGGASGLDYEINTLLGSETQAEKEYSEARMNLDLFTKQVKAGLTPRQLREALGMGSSALTQEIQQLEVALLTMKNRLGPDNSQVKDIQTRIDTLRDMDDQQEGANRDKAVAAIEGELRARLQVATDGVKSVMDKITSLNKQRTDLSAKVIEYNQTKEQEHQASELLRGFENERDKLELFIQQNNWSTAELAMPPDMPESPSFPKLPVTMALALTVGLVLALGIAFLRELLDTSVRSPRDIAKVGQLNLLGLIPHAADDTEAQAARLPLAIYEAPHSIVAEQFRQVRTRLQHSASLDTVRSLLVTGTSPNDGKTTVACNLAAGLALNGRRILLVDANFRRPQVHAIFNLPNEIGFGDVLNSLDVFDDAVRETEVPNLSVLTSGVKPSNPTELLESQLLIDFIERALEEYDHVIFDSGPLLLVSETAALAPRVDGVVTVVRARGNSRGLLQRLRDQLRQLKAEHLGVILNAVRSQSGGYYAPMIKTYYAYQNS